MTAVLRIDDFPGVKPEEFWKHNLENFKRFDGLLEKHCIEAYTLGVIPKHTTEEHIRWLSENPRVEVALHGIEHDNRFENEFREWETEDDIARKLLSAKEPLKECNGFGDVIRYIPPRNAVDLKTCRALQRASFTTVMGGPGSDLNVLEQAQKHVHVMYSRHPIWYGRSDEMMDRDGAVERILAEDSLTGRCLTLHWTWEWNIGLESLDRFLGQISSVFRE